MDFLAFSVLGTPNLDAEQPLPMMILREKSMHRPELGSSWMFLDTWHLVDNAVFAANTLKADNDIGFYMDNGQKNGSFF